jgi:ribonuclease D
MPTPTDSQPDTPTEATEATEPPSPLLSLRHGLPHVVQSEAELWEACEAVAGGTGPVAIDAERASGYRYSSRAYLVQVRREGAGTWLIDPIPFDSLDPLQEALDETEWILHAATQDLPCLAELGLRPARLFDTELAGRLLGYPRVGLATLVETMLGQRLAKEHSAVDWSTRPLPEPWLEYAALDVEPLVELREAQVAELEATGKTEWARQEFEFVKGFVQSARAEPWRRTSGLHKVRGRRGLAAVRALWETRDEIAARRDVTPGRIIPDSAIVTAAHALPQDRATLLATKGFHGRGAERYANRWVAAIRSALEMPESELPQRSPRTDGPPTPRAWAERDPVAARRLDLARPAMATLAKELDLPVENLLTPDHLRRTLWTPPATRDPGQLTEAVKQQLVGYGARRWQVDLAAPVLVSAIVSADEAPETPEPGASADEAPETPEPDASVDAPGDPLS